MNKKEISEIKKQFNDNNCAITKICGCYVDAEKNKVAVFKDSFLTLSDDERHKYFDILKKIFSGTPGKHTLNMEFPLSSEEEGGTQNFLYKLKGSRLEEEVLLEAFYDKIIELYDYDNNYLILLIHSVYDVPGKGHDEIEMEDASDEIYEHIACAICPVDLSKPALSYNHALSNFRSRERDWIVGMPLNGFLYPAFNERSADIHGILFYSKDPNKLQDSFIDSFLGCSIPLSPNGQKEVFHNILSEALGESCGYEVAKNIHEKISELITEHKDVPEPLVFDKADVKYILSESGVEQEVLDNFDKNFEEAAQDSDVALLATNIINTKTFELKTPDVVIKCNPERTDLMETMTINGRKCLVIEISEGIEVNGLPVHTAEEE